MRENQIGTNEELARERIAGWWDLLGEEPSYPVDTSTACRLIGAADYVVDPDTALAYVQNNIIPPVVAGENGRYEWSAAAIIALAAACEARRRWKPFSQIHQHKLTRFEMIQALCAHKGEAAFRDLAQFDIEALLALQVECSHDRGAVEVLVEAVREKLKLEGVL